MIRSSDNFVGSGEPFRRETPRIPSVEQPLLSAEPLRPVRGDIPRVAVTKADRIVEALRTHGPMPSAAVTRHTGIESSQISNVLKNCTEVLVAHYVDGTQKRRMFHLEGQDRTAAIQSITADAAPAPAPEPTPAPAPQPAPVPVSVPAPAPVAAPAPSNAKFAVWSDGSMTVRDTRLCCEVTLSRNDAAALLEFVEQIKLTKWRTA